MKNLLYVFADQWRYHAFGFSKEDSVATPNMDAFASSSLFCSQAVSTYPLCSPHRAALITGKHPLNLGFWTNCKIGLRDHIHLESNETTISDVLHDNGYYNGYIGKWHLDSAEMNYSQSPKSGAANWDAFTPKGERRHNIDYWYSYGAYDNHTKPHYWQDSDDMVVVDKWSPEHETDKAIEFFEARPKDKPFSLFISWNPPHPPYDKVPQRLLDMYPEESIVFRENVPQEMRENSDYTLKWREYYAAVTGLDEQFKRLIDYLKENNLYDNTIVVLSADHGDCMGSHGLYGKNIYYEESVRIPLVIHDPDTKCGIYDGILTSEDHMPTILDMLGIAIPESVEGKSHLAAINGGERVRLYSEHLMIPGMPELVNPFLEKGFDNRAFGWRAIRDERYTYVVDNGVIPGEEQKRFIFDNQEDPYQMHKEKLDKCDKRAIKYDLMLKNEFKKSHDNFLLGR